MMIEVGSELPSLSVTFTRERLVRYAGASGDFNPIHYSDAAARDLGLPGVLAHGMLTMGAGLRLVTDWLGDPARVRSYSVRFTKPVVVPDGREGVVVAYAGRVTSVTEDRATITLEATSTGQKVLGSAVVEVDRV